MVPAPRRRRGRFLARDGGEVVGIVPGELVPGVAPTAYANVDHTASAAMPRAVGFVDDGTPTGRYGTEVTRFVAR